MTDAGATLVVLGVGNVLLADDGVGVHVVREIERRLQRGEVVLPPGTGLVDGGTRGPALAPFIAGAAAVVVVDALNDGGIPGSIAVLHGALDALPASVGPATPGATGLEGLGGLLAAVRMGGVAPAAISLVGIRPAVIDVGIELSVPVGAALPRAMAAVLSELERLAHPGTPIASGPGQAAGPAAEAAA